jgi:drug/metabolite transporter (DMT)-like permease
VISHHENPDIAKITPTTTLLGMGVLAKKSLTGSALIKANLIVTTSMILFSLSLPLLEVLSDRYSMSSLVVIRNVLSGAVLILLGRMIERHHRLSAKGWGQALYAGCVLYLINTVCLTYGVIYAGAFSAAIIIALTPVVSAMIDVLTGEDRIGPRLGMALVISLLGGVLASIGWDESIRLTFGMGEAMLLLGVVTWVMISRYVDREMSDEPPITGLGVIIVSPGIALAGLVLILEMTGIEASGLSQNLNQTDLGLFILLGVVSSAGSMALWFRGVALLGVTITSLQQNLVPFFVLIQVYLLGQAIDPIKIAGGALVLLGALIAQIRKIQPAQAEAR